MYSVHFRKKHLLKIAIVIIITVTLIGSSVLLTSFYLQEGEVLPWCAWSHLIPYLCRNDGQSPDRKNQNEKMIETFPKKLIYMHIAFNDIY